MFFNHREEGHSDTCCNMVESSWQDAQSQQDKFCVIPLRCVKQSHSETRSRTVVARDGIRRRVNGAECPFYKMARVVETDGGDGRSAL